MKIKFTTIVAGTILAIAAVTGAILPASAIGTNPVVQQTINGKTDSLLLAVTKGGEHTKNARPSTNNKHQKNQASQKKAQERKNPQKVAEKPVKPTKAEKKDEARQKQHQIQGYKAGSTSLKK